jgi:hypothetical protein
MPKNEEKCPAVVAADIAEGLLQEQQTEGSVDE